MKIYEKPMANIEMIEIEDVITSSDVVDLTAAEQSTLAAKGATADNTIVFEW